MGSRLTAHNTLSYRDRSHFSAATPDHSLTPAGSGRTSPYPSIPPQAGGHRFADDLEGQNDDALEGLTAKVKLLKDITIGIGNEVRESTIQLSQMNDAFAETSGILAGTFRRMNAMASRQGGRWVCYMIFLILVFWFFVVVWLFR